MKQISFLFILIGFTVIGLFQLSFFQKLDKQQKITASVYIAKSIGNSICERPDSYALQEIDSLIADSVFLEDVRLRQANSISFVNTYAQQTTPDTSFSYYQVLFPPKEKEQTERTYRNLSSKAEYEIELNIPEGQKYTLSDSLNEAIVRKQIVNYAKQFLGLRYKWGGTTPNGFDCSGLVRYVYSNVAGIKTPRTSHYQSKVGEEVAVENAKPGDLVFFGYRRGKSYRTKHVGIVVGSANGKLKVLHSSRRGVRIDDDILSSKYYDGRFLFIKRYFGN